MRTPVWSTESQRRWCDGRAAALPDEVQYASSPTGDVPRSAGGERRGLGVRVQNRKAVWDAASVRLTSSRPCGHRTLRSRGVTRHHGAEAVRVKTAPAGEHGRRRPHTAPCGHRHGRDLRVPVHPVATFLEDTA